MTDNEKRAHDLAIVMCASACLLKIKEQILNGNSEVSVDYFNEYMNAYKITVNSFDSEFPDGK